MVEEKEKKRRSWEEPDEGQTLWLERPLDPDELRSFRNMLQEWERYKWAWTLIRHICYWAAGVFATIWMIREPLGKIIRALSAVDM